MDDLQQLRDQGVAWCTEKDFAALLDRIERLEAERNDAREQLRIALNGDAHYQQGEAALDENAKLRDRIERLEETIAVLKVAGSSHCVAAIRAYRARIERLEAALREIASGDIAGCPKASDFRYWAVDIASRALNGEDT